MPHLSLWTDLGVMFAVVIVVIVLVVFRSNINRRPRPMRRKLPERIDTRLAEILEQGSERPAGMPVQDALRQEAEREPAAEGQAAARGLPAESLPEMEDELRGEGRQREEGRLREEQAMDFPHEPGAGSARLFRREEEEPLEDALEGESSELRQRLKDRYAMYLRDKQGS